MGKLYISLGMIAMVFTLCLCLQGCSPAIMAAGGAVAAAGVGYGVKTILSEAGTVVLHAAGYEASVLGLKALPSADANIAAGAIVTFSKAGIDYVQGTPPTAAEINQWLTNEFSNADPVVLSFIANAAGQLDKYVPSVPVVLTPTQIQLIVSFLQGLQDGATAYLANPNVMVKAKYTLAKESLTARAKAKSPGAAGWFRVPVMIEIKK